MKNINSIGLIQFLVLISLFVWSHPAYTQTRQLVPAGQRPNVIIIYADDLGYGDLGCYGATKIHTPNVDQLAASGIRFTNAHASSATCTPSRYALMTGEYPWRRKGTAILPGDAALIVPTNKITLPAMFQSAGYRTGIVGKWHLGLGTEVSKDWNAVIKPGPNETGFDYSFIFPATADRVPTVFIEDHRVIGLDPADSIVVSYLKPVGNEPTGKDHPALLKMQSTPGNGHDQTIVNGIGRIGYMSGGKNASWTDEELSFTFLNKAKDFIEQNAKHPFFLLFTLTEPHVPRMPATIFKGKSGLGFRGDAILQLDWTVGEIMKQLAALHIDQHTIIIFSSDNGPVLDDGYQDGAVTMLNGHRPAGVLRGGKYSIFEAGTRIPFIISWPPVIKPGVSTALFSQVDLLASFASLLRRPLATGDASDSRDLSAALLGKTSKGRTTLIEHAGTLAIVEGNWKYIRGSDNERYDVHTNIELGNSTEPQLYNLRDDPGEKQNLALLHPEKLKALEALLTSIEKK